MASERKALPVIDTTRCTGCGWCVAVCPPHVLSLAVLKGRKSSQLHDEPGCTGCAKCAVRCPFDAIAMRREAGPLPSAFLVSPSGPDAPMPHTTPACPQCGLDHTYPDGENLVCPDCAFEWPQTAASSDDEAAGNGPVKDANGNPLADGDSVILIKDLKVKGASSVLKKGSKIKGIRLVDGPDGHNVDGKTELGQMLLKSAFLKKA